MELKDIMTMQEVQEMKNQLEKVFSIVACWMEKHWKPERELSLHVSAIQYGVRVNSV